jgi:hypothetical protein
MTWLQYTIECTSCCGTGTFFDPVRLRETGKCCVRCGGKGRVTLKRIAYTRDKWWPRQSYERGGKFTREAVEQGRERERGEIAELKAQIACAGLPLKWTDPEDATQVDP